MTPQETFQKHYNLMLQDHPDKGYEPWTWLLSSQPELLKAIYDSMEEYSKYEDAVAFDKGYYSAEKHEIK